jgi:hypothetical protein
MLEQGNGRSDNGTLAVSNDRGGMQMINKYARTHMHARMYMIQAFAFYAHSAAMVKNDQSRI